MKLKGEPSTEHMASRAVEKAFLLPFNTGKLASVPSSH